MNETYTTRGNNKKMYQDIILCIHFCSAIGIILLEKNLTVHKVIYPVMNCTAFPIDTLYESLHHTYFATNLSLTLTEFVLIIAEITCK